LILCSVKASATVDLSKPFEQIRGLKMGVVVNTMTIHRDSTFAKPLDDVFRAGDLVQIIGETKKEHEDDAQKQLYKWYQVRSQNGQTGWVFGDGLAIKEQVQLLPKLLAPHQYTKYKFTSGFEKSMIWFASILGRDANNGFGILGKGYQETYLMITNDLGNTLQVPITGYSQFGERTLDAFSIQEITNDQSPEIILQKSTTSEHNEIPEKALEIYGLQGGSLAKIFDERLNTREGRFKYLEIDQGLIRGFYFETKGNEVALNSFTYFWNGINRKYATLYPTSSAVIRGTAKSNNTKIYSSRRTNSSIIGNINIGEKVNIISWGKDFLEVQNSNGHVGYVRLSSLQVIDVDKADWISENIHKGAKTHLVSNLIKLPLLSSDTTFMN